MQEYQTAKDKPCTPSPNPCGTNPPIPVESIPKPLWHQSPNPCGIHPQTPVAPIPKPLWNPSPNPCGTNPPIPVESIPEHLWHRSPTGEKARSAVPPTADVDNQTHSDSLPRVVGQASVPAGWVPCRRPFAPAGFTHYPQPPHRTKRPAVGVRLAAPSDPSAHGTTSPPVLHADR